MKIVIFGSGYVGLVTAACLAHTGNIVTCIDINAEKIAQLKQGIIPLYEPGLSELIINNNYLQFTTDANTAVSEADIIFIAVGTPSLPDGSADLRALYNVTNTIKKHAHQNAIIVIKSTVPIGTTNDIQHLLTQSVVFNPEFLKQGHAVSDSMHPDRIIIGASSNNTIAVIKKLYAPFYSDEKKFLIMDARSAEMTKYAANAMLATKISFMNEMSQIADRVGADIYKVRDGIALDERIGPHFINPGMGYGGSCFPKDIKALKKTAETAGYHPEILHAIERVNHHQKLFLFDKMMRFFDGNIHGKTIAIWGLAFKPNTDDLRDSAAITLIQKLWEQGAKVQVYDPKAMNNFKKQFSSGNYQLFDDAQGAVNQADALCIVTEWDEFRNPDFNLLKQALRDQVIFDGRNVLDKKRCENVGLRYVGI